MNVAARLRARRIRNRNRRAVDNAIDQAATPAMRSELIAVAQHHNFMR